MRYAIIGSGKIGSALVRAFARKNIDVGIANTLADLKRSSLWRKSSVEASLHNPLQRRMRLRLYSWRSRFPLTRKCRSNERAGAARSWSTSRMPLISPGRNASS
jgi:hypothetical protein